MITHTVKVTNVSEYLNQIQLWHKKEQGPLIKTISRGESKKFDSPCLSTFGRFQSEAFSNKSSMELSGIERDLLKKWTVASQEAEQIVYPEDDWGCLLRARHHGLNCRVTDWTTNPLVSLFMASEYNAHAELNGFVYVANTLVVGRGTIVSEPFSESYELNPVHLPAISGGPYSHVFLSPPVDFHQRIKRQSGIFHVSSKASDSALDLPNMDTLEIEVPQECKRDILNELKMLNISSISLGVETPDSIAKTLNDDVKRKLTVLQ